MCGYCERAGGGEKIASCAEALELLAQLEQGEGLRRRDALALGARLLAWTDSGLSDFQCEDAGAAESREAQSA